MIQWMLDSWNLNNSVVQEIASNKCIYKFSNNGQCIGPNNECKCFDEYMGPTCFTHCPKMCSGHGHCSDGVGCLCNDDYSGEDCSI